MPLILGANSLAGGGYEVDNSLRFNSGSSDYLSRTPASASNRRTCTLSLWVKRGSNFGANNVFFDQEVDGSNFIRFYLGNDEKLTFYVEDSSAGGTVGLVRTNRVFRDVSAWYHFVFTVDVTQATSSDRIKLYVNGEQETSFTTSIYLPQNTDIEGLNTTNPVDIGRRTSNNDNFFNGYISEYNFIDGQALAPSDFGEFDEDSGIWKSIAYEGTYGTNGFYLEFKDSSALGDDTSGNGNDFTVNNLTSIDQTTDTPTNNFATMNPLDNFYAQSTFSEGNLKVVTGTTQYSSNTGTIGVSTGKWYWEVEFDVDNAGNRVSHIGIKSQQDTDTDEGLGTKSTDWGYRGFNGEYYNNATSTAYGNTYVAGDIISVALDLDNNKLYFAKNGVWQNSGDPTSGATGTGAISITDPASTIFGSYFPAFSYQDGSSTGTFLTNFGNPPFTISSGNSDANGYGNFEYEVPSGYYALCTKNLAEYG